MYVITTIPRNNTKAYFKGFECGFPNFSFKLEDAKRFKTKKEAKLLTLKNVQIERL